MIISENKIEIVKFLSDSDFSALNSQSHENYKKLNFLLFFDY
jgi:hypothetical protein